MSESWFYSRHGQQLGPVETPALQQLASSGNLQPIDLVWREGMAQWSAAREALPHLFPTSPRPQPPPLPYASPPGQFGSRPPSIGDNAGMRWLLPVGRSGWAIAAGYLGLLSFVILPAPLALIISIVAIRDLKKNPQKHGMGRAVFGLVMGILGTVALVAMIISRL